MSMVVDPIVAAPGVLLSPRAAEELRQLMVDQGKTDSALRVWVAGGGCSGLQYGLALDDSPAEEDDETFEQDGVRVFVDSMSLAYMRGAVVDYVDDVLGGGFKIENPNATSSCGCGSSFKTEDGAPSGGGCGGGCGCSR
jgi:iron-sulfur cluster assembly accessory protein